MSIIVLGQYVAIPTAAYMSDKLHKSKKLHEINDTNTHSLPL